MNISKKSVVLLSLLLVLALVFTACADEPEGVVVEEPAVEEAVVEEPVEEAVEEEPAEGEVIGEETIIITEEVQTEVEVVETAVVTEAVETVVPVQVTRVVTEVVEEVVLVEATEIVTDVVADVDTIVQTEVVTREVEAELVVEEEAVVDQEVVEQEVVEEETVDVEEEAEVEVALFGFAGVEEDVMMLASAMLDREVENAAEEQLGHVDDFYFDLETGNILFALVEHGGFIGIGEEHVPVPMTALALGPENDELILNVPEEVFEQLPDLDIDEDWPMGLDATWDDELIGFWEGAGMVVDPAMFEAVDPNLVASARDLVGYGVGYAGTPGVATADDQIVDIGQGRVEYALLSFLDVGVYGEEQIVVPWEAYDPAAFGNELVFDQTFNTEILTTAPRIPAGGMADVDVLEAGWDDEIRGFWAEQGFDVE